MNYRWSFDESNLINFQFWKRCEGCTWYRKICPWPRKILWHFDKASLKFRWSFDDGIFVAACKSAHVTKIITSPHLTFSCLCMYILWNCPDTGEMRSCFISTATCWGKTDNKRRSWKRKKYTPLSQIEKNLKDDRVISPAVERKTHQTPGETMRSPFTFNTLKMFLTLHFFKIHKI